MAWTLCLQVPEEACGGHLAGPEGHAHPSRTSGSPLCALRGTLREDAGRQLRIPGARQTHTLVEGRSLFPSLANLEGHLWLFKALSVPAILWDPPRGLMDKQGGSQIQSAVSFQENTAAMAVRLA